jgi:hypothetical protein
VVVSSSFKHVMGAHCTTQQESKVKTCELPVHVKLPDYANYLLISMKASSYWLIFKDVHSKGDVQVQQLRNSTNE